MLQADRQEGANMLIIKGMVYDFTVAPAPDKPEATQHTQMLRDTRLADFGYSREVAGTQLLIKETVDYLGTARVSKSLEDLGQRTIFPTRQQRGASRLYALRVYTAHLTNNTRRIS